MGGRRLGGEVEAANTRRAGDEEEEVEVAGGRRFFGLASA